MKKLLACILSAILLFTFTSGTLASSKMTLKKIWSYKNEASLPEKWLYHVVKDGNSIYMTGNGQGYARMLAISPKGKRVWEKELSDGFAVGLGETPVLYVSKNGTITKYNLTTGGKIHTVKTPFKSDYIELAGVSLSDTLYVVNDENEVLEISDDGKVISNKGRVSATEDNNNLKVYKPNVQNWDDETPKKVEDALTKSKPAFAADKKKFEAAYGKGAKYEYIYSMYKALGSELYVAANYDISGTKTGKKEVTHSVLYRFTKDGKKLAAKDLGDLRASDIAVNSKGVQYVSLHTPFSSSKSSSVVRVFDKKYQQLTELKLTGQTVFEGKLINNKLYLVTDRYFYVYQ
ncbi:PQQ-binding-like beta-propeller repeat protein [Peribacillus glennii]|nr:hypothetical protein [Peribacillus glennii]